MSRNRAKRQLMRWDRYMRRYNGFGLSWMSNGHERAMIRYGMSGRNWSQHLVDAPRPS